jgi:hypothetical protein
MASLTFDPGKDTWDEFKTRAPTTYFRELYRAAGGRADVAIETAKTGKRTFYKYCTKQVRQEVLKSIKNQRSRTTD